ncbi:MAG TPA: uroporphyrinogen decarboxylase family protein [Ruminiclostridium sp.]
MNKTERIKEALRHENTGCVPYAINFTVEAIQLYGERILQDYASEQVINDYKSGILNLTEAVSLGIGNHMLYVYAPWWDWCNVPDYFLREYDAPSHLPETIGHGSYEEFFKKIKYIKENYDVYLLATIWGSHWEKANFCRGIENFLGDLAGSPEWAQELLDLIIRKNIVMLENFINIKEIDGVLLGSDWGTQNDLIMSPTCWRNMIKNGEKQEYDLIKKHGKDVFVHSCGNVQKILGDLVEMGLDALNPLQPECMDIYKIKENFGDKLTFFGGISTQRTLPYGTSEEVVEESKKIIKAMSVNGGYITAPSQEIQTDVPYENVRALIDTAKLFAK